MNLRPEVFHSVKLGDETQVRLPCFAFVILEKPQSPPSETRQRHYPFFVNKTKEPTNRGCYKSVHGLIKLFNIKEDQKYKTVTVRLSRCLTCFVADV